MKVSLDHVASLWMTADPSARRAAIAALDRRPKPEPRATEEAPAPLLLTQRDAARVLGLSRQTLFRWARAGVLRPVEIAGVRRYRVDDLKRLAAG